MKHIREYKEFLNENTNARRFQNKGKLRYSDQFSGNISLSKTIGTELGFDPKKGSSGVGFDNVSFLGGGGGPAQQLRHGALAAPAPPPLHSLLLLALALALRPGA